MIRYELDTSDIVSSDADDTLDLLRDAQAVWSSVFQGMAPVGDWLQARIACLVRDWIGGDWQISHGQVFDPANRNLQSRSWDLIIHRRPPDDYALPDGSTLPPAATESGPWVLLPKHLCAAVIDTKGRYDAPRIYAAAPALNPRNDSTIPQLELLAPDIRPALLILASTRKPLTVMREGEQHHLPTFVVAQAIDHKGSHGTERVTWEVARTANGTLPLDDFRTYIIESVRAWHARNQ